MYVVTFLWTACKTLSMFWGWAMENNSWKYDSATWAICSSEVRHLSSESNTPEIWFFLRRWLARLWKYFVFLSPVGSQINQDLCRQKSSSWWIMFVISALRLLMVLTFSTLFYKHNSSMIFFFSCNCGFKSPKISQLQSTRAKQHLFIFSKSFAIGLPFSTIKSATYMIFSQSGWVAHLSSNLCGIFFFKIGWGRMWVVTRIGL